ncbi:hypothetical protein [Variovorax sp. YR266]|uniref:hypothetical protein n=1 Tax=Variovorax sp. YR266 TaxID=1884386 RepID=UPI000B81D594|nr:hypothetical protein [Variovorax sp. YR266]
MELDPHQKGILSDDFGVAISTEWLVGKLGGVKEIVDGRRFVINMGVSRTRTGRLPKTGTGKCPDFILEDMQGRFHVLECKGTQSGRGYLDRAMDTGRQQKLGVRIAPAIRGERLVIGVALAGEGDDAHSQLIVKDPEDEPLTEIREKDVSRANQVLVRLSLARALNLSGFTQAAFEIAWPEGLDARSPEVELLSAAERKSLSRKVEDRMRGWQEEINTEFRSAPQRQIGDFIEQEMRFDLPPIELDSGDVATRLKVRRGFRSSVVQDLSLAGKDLREAATDKAVKIAAGENRVSFDETSHSVRLDYGDLFFSEIAFD